MIFSFDLDLLKLKSLNVERLNYIVYCNFHIIESLVNGKIAHHLISYASILLRQKNWIDSSR